MKKTILSMLLLLLLVAGAKAQNDTPLTFEAIAAGTVTLEKVGDFTPNSGIQYRLGETGDWSSYTYGTGISLQVGDKLQFRSTSSDAYAIDEDRYSHFTCTADCYLYGSVGTLFNNSNSLPVDACFRMFYGNTHIKNCPGKSLALPATTLANSCYTEMFSGCTSLTMAPELPANTLTRVCYSQMFEGCTSLTTAPELPATTLADYCYYEMFSGCTKLTMAPGLPATTLADCCYRSMFSGCTNLTTAPDLPATTLANQCYTSMFSGCTKLTVAPALPATTTVFRCYQAMFSSCTKLTVAPALPADTLTYECYSEMFEGCTSLTTAPALPADSLTNGCYFQMFKGCTSLNYVICLAIKISASNCTTEWLDGVADKGTFIKNGVMESWPTGGSGIPNGWRVEDLYENDYEIPLTFHALEAGTITVNLDEGATLNPIQYSLNNAVWTNVAWNTPIALSANDVIHFRGNNGTCYDETNQAGFRFVCSNNCFIFGNLMSLIDKNNFATSTTLTHPRAFYRLFQTSESNTTLLNHPYYDVVLPATTLTAYCYGKLFGNCQGITRAPSLPATTLQEGCYFEMFYECAALTTPPALPATTLAGYCYYKMFNGCTHLATAPTLPATTIASNCYYSMFSGCTNLTVAPELPATELFDRCYLGMFQGCTKLTTAPALPATTLAENCYYNMFSGCTNLTAAPALPAGTLTQYCYYGMFNGCKKLTTAPTLPATTLANYCYYGMFQDCTRLTTAPALPATTLADHCYESMFNGCTALTTAPALPATTLTNDCYYEMFRGCTALTTAPALPATTLSDYCYQKMFYNCSQLNYVVCLATDKTASDCVKSWLYGVANSGTFVEAPNTTWPSGNSGIPSGWMVNTMDNVFTTDGNWNVAANWSNNAVPTAGSSVVIAANATIPSGHVADAKCVIVNEGKTLTIADGGQLIHDNMVNVTLQKNITGYGSDNSAFTGWYTIASPLTQDFTPTDDMLTDVYDLFYYDEPYATWRNHKQEGDHYHFNIKPQKGYLYANSNDKTLAFAGTTQATDNTVTVPLSYAAEGDLKGYNLVGNPFTCNVAGNITLGGDALTSYYIADGTDNNGQNLIACNISERAIKPAEGFFVQATEVGQQLVFNPAPTRGDTPTEPAFICIEAGEASFMDRAYVQIGHGNTLRKMSLNDHTPKVYVMNDGKDYAATTIATATGELPVNFEAAKNGTYTITVRPEGVEMDYLHLIDNKTGADVDLLALRPFDGPQGPVSYTFTAKTTDYASRFCLVFSIGGNANGDNEATFAYVCNGEIVITGVSDTCDASLQVIDVMGRIIVSRDAINRVSTGGFVPGVYVLRLIQGEKVRTQKIVIQ